MMHHRIAYEEPQEAPYDAVNEQDDLWPNQQLHDVAMNVANNIRRELVHNYFG